MSTPAQDAQGAGAPAAPHAQGGIHASLAPLPPFSQFIDPATAAPRWRRWINRLDHYFHATRETDGTVKRSMMLHVGGDELFDLFEHLPEKGGDNDYDAAVTALNKYFDPQLNPNYEIFMLRQAMQTQGESVDVYYTRLRRLASTCTGIDHGSEIRAQIIQGCRSSTLRKLILR